MSSQLMKKFIRNEEISKTLINNNVNFQKLVYKNQKYFINRIIVTIKKYMGVYVRTERFGEIVHSRYS